MAGNGTGNEVMGMGGNGYTKSFPYISTAQYTRYNSILVCITDSLKLHVTEVQFLNYQELADGCHVLQERQETQLIRLI